MADADGITKLVELTKDIKITMFTTIDADGHFVSRPMAQQLTEPDGDLWFFAESKVTGERYEGGNQGTVTL
jgi:general stress protein 26